jgi:putative transcriptional regulator
MSENISTFANHLLIAMPKLHDPSFERSVVYICEHSEHGAVGMIINRPLEFNLSFVFEQMNIAVSEPDSNSLPLMFGGPVQPERGFVIHRPEGIWRSSLSLAGDITVTTSSDIIKAIASGDGPEDALVTLGYAGWTENQLEEEVRNNAWIVCPFDPSIIYDTPFDKRWEAAANSLGFDINFISSDEGHA